MRRPAGRRFFIVFSGIGLKRKFGYGKMAVSKGFCRDEFIQWTTKVHYSECSPMQKMYFGPQLMWSA